MIINHGVVTKSRYCIARFNISVKPHSPVNEYFTDLFSINKKCIDYFTFPHAIENVILSVLSCTLAVFKLNLWEPGLKQLNH